MSYIADSAVVTESNLERMWNCIYFATRLPATYGECARAIADAVEKVEWEDVGVLAETKPTKNRPAAYYKTYETEVELYEKKIQGRRRAFERSRQAPDEKNRPRTESRSQGPRIEAQAVVQGRVFFASRMPKRP